MNLKTNISKGLDTKLASLIIQFSATLSFQLMVSFLPLFIENDLNYPLIEATYWTGIAQFITSSLWAFTAPFWGFLCDRIGAKKITLMLLGTNAVVNAGMAVSTNMAQVLLFRGLQGSFGGYSTAMFALVATIYVGAELKQALSYQIAMMTLGQLIGPALGGVLASLIGYRLTLVASSLLFVCIIPIVFLINVPHPSRDASEKSSFTRSDFRAIIPDFASLILVYACISFIMPTIPWFLRSFGTPNEQLLLYTTLTTTLSGVAFAIATPLLPRIVTDRKLPFVSLAASALILMTAFAANTSQFIALRTAMGAIQAGIPPFLLGGKGTARRGTAMGFLNSARFMGIAIGPITATSILGDGEPSKVIGMFATMASLSLLASIIIYFAHKRT
jgi:DHA1 family multidrug resistance protein-like MFS transporter